MNLGAERILTVFNRTTFMLYSIVFLYNLSIGLFMPIFSLYANYLGASLLFIGMLSAIPGLSQILAIIPLGLLSDKKGRKILIIMGLLFFSITPLLYILSKNAYGLILPQIFFGLGMSAASPMLIVYLFEVIDPTKTGPVFGLYTMFMGSGFALGSLLGGYFAHFFGYPTNYYSSSIIASIAMIASLIAIKEDPRSYVKKIGSSQTNVKSVFSLIRDPRILIAGLTVFGIVSIDKTIFGFFPLYGKSVGLNELDMGYIFTIRAICSTVIRMPTGLSLRKIGKRNLMYIALLTSSLSAIFVSRFHQPVFLAVFIAIEGIGMGILLTVGPLFVLESFEESSKGGAMGVYRTFEASGRTISPFILGLAADILGLHRVFMLSSVVGILAFLIIIILREKT